MTAVGYKVRTGWAGEDSVGVRATDLPTQVFDIGSIDCDCDNNYVDIADVWT